MPQADNSAGSVIRGKTRLGQNGRFVIPAEIREALGVKPGDTIVMEAENGSLRIESYMTMLGRIQHEIAALVPPGVSLADELIADRRAEAGREAEEFERDLEQERLRREQKIA